MTNLVILGDEEHDVTLFTEGAESNWSLIGRALIDPLDDLSASKKQTVQSQRSWSRPYVGVRKINQPESCWWNGIGQGPEKNRLYCVIVIDTLAFENEALPTATSLGMDSMQERFWVHNCLRNHCLPLFSLVYFCLCVLSHKMAVLVAISFPQVSLCLLFPPPVSFVRGC